MGATLEQRDEDKVPYVVAYFSRSCTEAEAKYGSFKGEACSLVLSTRHWHYYLRGKENIYRSDNSALQWLMTARNLPPMAARWALLLSELDFRIEHIKGKDNLVCDYLSRPTGSKEGSYAPWPASAEEAERILAIEAAECSTAEQSVPVIAPVAYCAPVHSADESLNKDSGSARSRVDTTSVPEDKPFLETVLDAEIGESSDSPNPGFDAYLYALAITTLLANLHSVSCGMVLLMGLTTATRTERRATSEWAPLPRFSRPSGARSRATGVHPATAYNGRTRGVVPLGVLLSQDWEEVEDPPPAKNGAGSPLGNFPVEDTLPASPDPEIWRDENTLNFLRYGKAAISRCSFTEQKRVMKRAQNFFFEFWPDGYEQLIHLPSKGTGRICPPPEHRDEWIEKIHSSRSGLNHLGVAKTYAQLALSFWWRGMLQDTQRVVSSCAACDMQKARPVPSMADLHPLPIVPLFFRFHSDLAGPFPPSSSGKDMVMIVVDSFSGAIFLFALKGKSSAATADIGQFVISLLGSPAEWVTDGGGEWQGEFEEMLQRNNVVPRVTSPYHPQANGKAERSVQVVKQLLQRRLAEPLSNDGKVHDFEALLPHIMMAYNCSKHAATGYSPYFLMYGRDVLVPAQARAVMHPPLDTEDPEALEGLLLRRAEVLRHAVPRAAGNRRQAQGTDMRAHTARHTGNLRPSARENLRVGDPVYLTRRAQHGLELTVQPHILQIVEIKPSGVLRLQGADGRCITNHRDNVAPCGLIDLDLRIDPGTARVAADASCEICEEHDPRGTSLVLCSMCSRAWHWKCLRRQHLVSAQSPPASSAAWYCPYCVQLRILPVAVDLDGMELQPIRRNRRRRPAAAKVLQAVPVFRLAWQLPAVSSPDDWSLTSREAMTTFLQRTMPGRWGKAFLTLLSTLLPSARGGYSVMASAVSHAPTERGAYDALRHALRWDRLQTVLDPWAGYGSTQEGLSDLVSVLSTDLVQRGGVPLNALANALEPGDLTAICGLYGRYDGIVASPWFSVLDIALCAALTTRCRFIAFHVPGHYLTSAHPARAAFLQRLSEEQRLLVLANLPRSANGRRCAWLLIFASSSDRDWLVTDDVQLRCPSWIVYSVATPPSGPH